MKTIDADGRALCKLQAQAFETSLGLSCASAVFVRRFMNSDVARRMDDEGFLSESNSPEGIVAEVEAQYGRSDYGSVKFSAEELHWMGYLYRYWACAFGMSSRAIYKIVGANELRSLFFAYHSLDPEQAILRIAESKGIKLDEDPIKKGVAALRRIHEKRCYEYHFVGGEGGKSL